MVRSLDLQRLDAQPLTPTNTRWFGGHGQQCSVLCLLLHRPDRYLWIRCVCTHKLGNQDLKNIPPPESVFVCVFVSMIVVAGLAAASRFGEFVGAGVIFWGWNGIASAST